MMMELNFSGVHYYCSICHTGPHCGGSPYRAHDNLRNSVPGGHFLSVVCVLHTETAVPHAKRPFAGSMCWSVPHYNELESTSVQFTFAYIHACDTHTAITAKMEIKKCKHSLKIPIHSFLFIISKTDLKKGVGNIKFMFTSFHNIR